MDDDGDVVVIEGRDKAAVVAGSNGQLGYKEGKIYRNMIYRVWFSGVPPVCQFCANST